MISIRRVVPADLTAILRLEKQCFARDAWHRDQFSGYLVQPERSVFLLAAVNTVVTAYVIAYHTASRAEIDSIAVSKAHRGNGIAAALLRRSMNTLRRRGLTSVFLNVRLDNEAAIGLYRKLSFEPVRRVETYYEDQAPALRMRRRL